MNLNGSVIVRSKTIKETVYVGTEKRSAADLIVSGDTVTAPEGFYQVDASKAVAHGTEGVPAATKGQVSDHSVLVTPSVTNEAGYIAGGTKTGEGVLVTAAELVSGNKAITENGSDIDVTNYETASVDVPLVNRNLFLNTLNPSVASANDYPALVIGTTSVWNGTPEVATHGIKAVANSNKRPFVDFGNFNSTNGLAAGHTYVWSFDCEFRLLSDYTGSDTYTLDTRVATAVGEAFDQSKTPFATIVPGTVQQQHVERIFSVPANASVAALRVMASAGDSVEAYRSGYDYVAISNLKLEEVHATPWSPAPEDN